MSKRKAWPAALTIAGSDSGGGAGIQADLKTFALLHVHGLSALTAVTAQNPKTVAAVLPIPPAMVAAQIESGLNMFQPTAAKTGMLCNKAIISAVARSIMGTRLLLVIDPVLISTSGRRLLALDAESILQTSLIPQASLVTPNIPEAAAFLGRKISGPEAVRQAARDLQSRWGCPVLVKGGHLGVGREIVDFFCDGKRELLFSTARVTGVRTHGTGCTYSAAITAGLASGLSLVASIGQAKNYITAAIRSSCQVGRAQVLGFALSD